MAGFMPDLNNRGRYKCPYCTHKTWKQYAAAERHIKEFHPDEAEKADLQAKNRRLEQDKADLKRQLELVKKPAEKKVEYYDEVIYCITDQRVRKVGMPKGQDISSTPCDICGMKTLHRVINAQSYWF